MCIRDRAYLHRSEATTRSIETYRVALKIDFFAVGVSIAATGIPTAYHHLELYYGVSGALLALTGVLVVLSLELPRIIVTLTHVVLTIVFIGYATYWNYVWAAGSVAYAAAEGSQDQVRAMPRRCRAFQAAGSRPWRRTARSTAAASAAAVGWPKVKPVPSGSSASSTVSARPPTAWTTGTVPYRRA